MIRRVTIVRAEGLAIEAEAVVCCQKGQTMSLRDKHESVVTAGEGRFVRFFLETNQIVGWNAESEAEADRVIGEIIAAKMGDDVMSKWIVEVELTFYEDATGWKKDLMEIPCEAGSRSQAMEFVKAGLPGNVQTRKYKVLSARPATAEDEKEESES